MSNPYRVTIRRSVERMRASKGDVAESIYLLTALRERGVPVIGPLFIKGVEHGSLTIEREADEFVYTWVSDPRSGVTEDYDPAFDGPVPHPDEVDDPEL